MWNDVQAGRGGAQTAWLECGEHVHGRPLGYCRRTDGRADRQVDGRMTDTAILFFINAPLQSSGA